MNILDHEGKKYVRVITCSNGIPIQGDAGAFPGVAIDVYDILEAFAVTCPARTHAIKKLLCAGVRGKGDALEDLQGALAAVSRAIELEEARLYLDAELEDEIDRVAKEVSGGQETKRQQIREDSVRSPLKMVDPTPEGA